MLQQIQDSKADASLVEDKILEAMDKIDKAKLNVDAEKKKLLEEEKFFNEQKAKLENELKEIEQRLVQLEGQRKQLMPGIDKHIMAQYERILKSRDGLAIVPVKDSSCLGCHMSMPPQVINLIRMYDHIVTCEVCNRILCIPDE